MTTKLYEVTWGGNGNIVWKPLENSTAGASTIADSTINLTRSLQIFDIGLNVLNVGLSAAILSKVNKIDEKVEKINAKFDLLFLDKSIEYFLNRTKENVFLNQENLNILENDLLNALCSIETSKDLRVPAYLSHKIYLISEAVSQINEAVYMILHNGSAPRVKGSEIDNWVHDKGAEIDLLPNGGFASQAEILNAVEKVLSSKETPFLDKFKISSKSRHGIMVRVLSEPTFFEVAHPLILLLRELRLASTFFTRLEQEISKREGKILLKVS